MKHGVHKPCSTAHQTGFIDRINCGRTREEISEHTDSIYAHICSINGLCSLHHVQLIHALTWSLHPEVFSIMGYT